MGSDERLVMHGRLWVGGLASIVGDKGCLVARTPCYRCGKSMYDPPVQQLADNGNVPGWIRTQARQQTDREWAQATRGSWGWNGDGGSALGSTAPAAATGAKTTEPKAETTSSV